MMNLRRNSVINAPGILLTKDENWSKSTLKLYKKKDTYDNPLVNKVHVTETVKIVIDSTEFSFGENVRINKRF